MNLFIHFHCAIAFHYIIKPQFIHLSPVDEPLYWLQLEAIMNNADENLSCILASVAGIRKSTYRFKVDIAEGDCAQF